MTQSLADHRIDPEAARAACSAIRNSCIVLSRSDSLDSQCRLLNDVLSKSVDELANAIAMHHLEDELVTEQAAGALQAACAAREGLALSLGTAVDPLVVAMNRFPASVDLQRHGIGVLGQYIFASNEIPDLITDDLVGAVVRFIQKEVDEDDAVNLIHTAIEVILAVATSGFQGVEALLRNKNMLDSIMSCMSKYPDSSSIQYACIDILSNTSLDPYTRADVSRRGGTGRIISAL